MDERVFASAVGMPVPEWDLRHRLPIDRPVGPEVRDTGTIFRINSTFMDVTDQPYQSRQNLGAFTFALACIVLIEGAVATMMWTTTSPAPDIITLFVIAIICGFMAWFARLAFRFGRDEFFALKRRPIRFNRGRQTIQAVRRRRFLAKPGEGDETWEAAWDAESIFCVHANHRQGVLNYHIRHYVVDAQGNVLRAFSIGREWYGNANLPGLLSQWNYWCEYMNHGPENLPKPPLYFSECETAEETFLFCLYHMCPDDGAVIRILHMPFIAVLAAVRLLSIWTCRDPVWPKAIEAVSSVASDAYAEPAGATPVGWGPTAVARESGTWPREDKRAQKNWRGEPDAIKNAMLWAEESAPLCPTSEIR